MLSAEVVMELAEGSEKGEAPEASEGFSSASANGRDLT